MNAEQRRKYGNWQRAEVDRILRRCRKPDSKSSRRLRFEALHDEWRVLVGLPQLVREP